MSEKDAVRKFATNVRQFFGVDSDLRVDVVKCITAGHILTKTGVKRLVYQIVRDANVAEEEMRGLDAATISSKDRAVIKALERIDKGARAGVSRDIFTLAHELGHVVYCHPREALARVTNATRSTPASPTVKRYEAEANNFASFFLVKDEFAQDCKTPSELCRRFGVSFSFAENWLRDRERTRERPRVIEGFEKLLRDLNGKSDPTGVSFPQASNGPEPLIGGVPSSLPCYCTGGWLVSTCGGKYKCTNCQRVVELPDGDSFGSQSNP